MMGRRRFGGLAVLIACLLTVAAVSADAQTPKGAGTEHRQWVEGPRPSPASPPIYQITEQERLVPVRDGIRLQTKTWLPVLPGAHEHRHAWWKRTATTSCWTRSSFRRFRISPGAATL